MIFNLHAMQVTYELFHVLMVTLYYINPVCNPVIYLVTNPLVRDQIYGSGRGGAPWSAGKRRGRGGGAKLVEMSC